MGHRSLEHRQSGKISAHACNARENLRPKRNGNNNISIVTLSNTIAAIWRHFLISYCLFLFRGDKP